MNDAEIFRARLIRVLLGVSFDPRRLSINSESTDDDIVSCTAKLVETVSETSAIVARMADVMGIKQS